jgi:hypothetical protein
MDSMDNHQAQKLKDINERLNQPFVPSVAAPGYPQHPVNYTQYPANNTQYSANYTQYPPNYTPVPDIAHTHAQRFTNEGVSQPYGGRVATDERVSQPFGATATMPARPQPSVNYTQASVDERLVQPYVPSVAGPFYPGYMYPTHDHQRRIDAALEMYKTPARQYTQLPISERVYVDTPQWSYTTRTKRPIVKLPVAEATETANVQQPWRPRFCYIHLGGRGHRDLAQDNLRVHSYPQALLGCPR